MNVNREEIAVRAMVGSLLGAFAAAVLATYLRLTGLTVYPLALWLMLGFGFCTGGYVGAHFFTWLVRLADHYAPNVPLGYITASQYIVKQHKKVHWMYRQHPRDEHDSGWCVFSGDEDQAYLDNLENLGPYDAKTILAIDASIAPLLVHEPGTAFTRERDDEAFRQVPFPVITV